MLNFIKIIAPKLVSFSLANIFILTIGRIVLYFSAGLHQETVDWALKFDIFFTGLRFDAKYTFTFILILFILPAPIACFFSEKVINKYSNYLLPIILSLTLFLTIANINYFNFSGSVLDKEIFAFFQDDTFAIIKTILMDSQMMLAVLIALLFLFAVLVAFRKLTKLIEGRKIWQKDHANFSIKKVITGWSAWLILFVLVAILSRGSIGLFGLSQFTSSISGNSTINAIALNPYQYIKIAISNYKYHQITNRTEADLLEQLNIKSFEQLLELASYTDEVGELNKSTLNDPTANKPLKVMLTNTNQNYNVILFFLEGWSTYVSSSHSNENPVLGEFAKHGNEDTLFFNFFSNGVWTNQAIEATFLNSPIFPLSQSTAPEIRYKTSQLIPFKDSGYITKSFSGGFSSWRDHASFWPNQGFDQYIGRKDIERAMNVSSANPWGIQDHNLFNFLKLEMKQHAKTTPANLFFYFVRSTNNHFPIYLPEDYIAPEFDLQKLGFISNEEKKLEIIKSFHYMSDVFGKFMTWLKQSKFASNTIVLATGDHVMKGFTNFSLADEFNGRAVPLYIYLPSNHPKYSALKNIDKNINGSHEDIFPTLFHLALNSATYYNFGIPLLLKDPSLSYGWMIDGRFLFNNGVANYNINKIHKWQDPNAQGNRLVNFESDELSTFQRNVIDRHDYIQYLKHYLILKDANSNSN